MLHDNSHVKVKKHDFLIISIKNLPVLQYSKPSAMVNANSRVALAPASWM